MVALVKVALICDWLVVYAGAERVLEQILACYPQADIFCMVDFIPDGERQFLQNKKSHTSWIQKLPFAKKKYRHYLALMPTAIKSLDVSLYDLVISSSHAVAKGIKTRKNQLHISYIHSPMRYAWDLRDQYLKETGLNRGLKGVLARSMLAYMKRWDLRNTESVDCLIANSAYIADRIQRAYGRESRVIYPPVLVNESDFCESKEGYYVTASRMVPYKKIDLIVEAFSKRPDKKLYVIGDGPEYAKIASKASSNITLMGFQSDAILKEKLQKARAFIFAAEEDFGILPVEAQACGTPVIAYGKGGALETVRGLDSDKATGVFFNEQTTESLLGAVELFEESEALLLPKHCAQQAATFSVTRFKTEFKRSVEEFLK